MTQKRRTFGIYRDGKLHLVAWLAGAWTQWTEPLRRSEEDR